MENCSSGAGQMLQIVHRSQYRVAPYQHLPTPAPAAAILQKQVSTLSHMVRHMASSHRQALTISQA